MAAKKIVDSIYKINPDIACREIKGQLLFLHPEDRRLYTTNNTGHFVWRQLVRKSPAVKIIALFQKEFSLPEEEATRDVRKFLGELEKKQIIRKVNSR
jgi:hypothetical protein